MGETVRRMTRFPARAVGSADSGAISGCPHIHIQMPAFFPAGLVLYRLTNTLLSIAQRCNLNRRIEAEAIKSRAVE